MKKAASLCVRLNVKAHTHRRTFPIGLVLLSFVSGAAAADQQSADLWRNLGLSAALLGGGLAHVSDSSATDRNPAGVAMQKLYSLSGEFGWLDVQQKSRMVEGSVCDSVSSELAACLKYRQTQKVTGAKDRRFSLALGEMFAGGLVFGVAGDYVQYAAERSSAAQSVTQKTAQRVRAGVSYALMNGLWLAAASDGLYDSTGGEKSHGLGLSAQVGQYFLLNGDLLFDAVRLREMVAGVSVFPRDFLDFAVSYGYDPQQSRHRMAGGLVVKSQQARLIYTLSSSSGSSSQLFHTLGMGFYLSSQTEQRSSL